MIGCRPAFDAVQQAGDDIPALFGHDLRRRSDPESFLEAVNKRLEDMLFDPLPDAFKRIGNARSKVP